ncbi:hypothetical protein [Mesorhizobium sp. NZP2077]|uniref:hypothetical protein n=1 Tax=Mesorhizobium sp. NZP2077 TaxID=2483404 RepID=UPI001556BA7E|nr:hypothetical protein [Mesorhizobium sp. NZP2077]QKC80776.1 hypothetical protein EB232_03075 [Mesorhizobium sp. NZP2077]QKD14172.1 hypothetical protein HGP13_03055 [Mesorhizobium sp. NZP2077]
MSSSPNISFVLHDVARLLRKRRSRTSGLMRSDGQKTRDEPFAGLSFNARQHLLPTLSLIKSNLLAACTQLAVDREKVHG